MGTIPMYSNKTAWKGELQWEYSGGYVTVTMRTWKTDGYPSSATSGAHFQATITIGSSSKSFSFQQQETYTMTVGVHSTYVSGNEVYISGIVKAPYGVSMFNNPLEGSANVVLYQEEEPEAVSPSEMTLGAKTVTMGQTLNISLLRYSGQCIHTLKYRILPSGASVTIAGEVGIFFSWKVPDLSDKCINSLSVTVEISCHTYLNGVYCGAVSEEVEILLPGATKPVCSQSAIMGSTLAITLDRACLAYTHSLSCAMGENTREIAQGVEDTYAWEIPLELAGWIPTLTKGTAQIQCVTYLRDMEVGRESITVSLTVPDNEQTKPAASMILKAVGDLEDAFAGMYIRGITGVQADFTASSQYSRVRSYSLLVDGQEVTGNPAVIPWLRSYGTVTVTGKIIDERGYVRQLQQQIQVVAYERPGVTPYPGESAVVAVRCDLQGNRDPRGQNLLVKAARTYTAILKDGKQLNTCALRYRIKKTGDQDYSAFDTLIPEEETEHDHIQMILENAVPEVKHSYTLQLESIDALGGYSVITLPVAALTVPLHMGRGNGNVAVGKYCDPGRGDAFEIGLTTYFDKGIALRQIFSGREWPKDTQLGSMVAEADVGAVFLYSLFMGVCQERPVWLMRLGDTLFGEGTRIRCQGSSVTLEEAPSAMTALYAVL